MYWFCIVTRVSQYCTVCLFSFVHPYLQSLCYSTSWLLPKPLTFIQDSGPLCESRWYGDTFEFFFLYLFPGWISSLKAWSLKLQAEGLWNRCYCVVAWGLIHKILSSFHCKGLSTSIHSTYVIVMPAQCTQFFSCLKMHML